MIGAWRIEPVRLTPNVTAYRVVRLQRLGRATSIVDLLPHRANLFPSYAAAIAAIAERGQA